MVDELTAAPEQVYKLQLSDVPQAELAPLLWEVEQ